MKKYFISSDIHSFFSNGQEALLEKGFDINNSEHIIVICGDIFDRGPDARKVYEFLKNLPKERRILIRGNHEILLEQLVDRRYADKYDRYNGTYDTLFQLADIGFKTEGEFKTKLNYELMNLKDQTEESRYTLINKYQKLEKKLYTGLVKDIIEWIHSDEWINYWETKKHIFVHSFIPVEKHIDGEKTKICGYIIYTKDDTYKQDGRDSIQDEGDEAMGGCPGKQAKEGLNKTGKTIVCGHGHTSDFFNNLTEEKKDIYDCPIFISEKYKLIGLDACTAGSGKVNVLVLAEEEL